ncbi:IS66 family insertion sequence element accessory protein TnpB [Parvibaculum sp.]|uniref:IS66 family insertion sequence element accessory protein TnpB n=1 Tax=Parvibaculum sp. TaxID=2024848 RepID=UPI003299774B
MASMVQSALAQDPFTGTVFVFRAKRADRMKILFWDGSGLVPLGTLLRNALPGSG